MVPLDRVRRRQGPRDHPVRRAADLLRGRHRLRHREVQPRLRPPHLHLGRRPPRDGGPGPERRPGDGLRPRGGPDAALLRWVRFVRDGVEVSMSKRAGEFITLDELLDEIGVDAARWFFASRAATSAIDFDIELAKKQSAENPVYYVQYAHARDRVDPAQGGRGRARAGGRRDRVRWTARSEGALARVDRPPARGGRGRRLGRGDARRDGLRDGARDRSSTRSTATRKVVDPERAGAVGQAAGAGSRRPRRRSPTRWACSGSPRRSRCSRTRPGRRQPARPRTFSSRPTRSWRRGDDDGHGRAATDRDRRRPASGEAADDGSSPSSRTPAHRRGCPIPLRSRSPNAPFGPIDDDRPVAAPAGRRLIGARRRRPRPASRQPQPELEFAECVLEADRPAGAQPRGEIVGQVDLDRRLAAAVLLRVEDLLGRCGRLRERGVRRPPSRRSPWSPWAKVRPLGVREEERLAKDRRHRRRGRR